jgi:hypothetical protein
VQVHGHILTTWRRIASWTLGTGDFEETPLGAGDTDTRILSTSGARAKYAALTDFARLLNRLHPRNITSVMSF